MSLAEIRRKEAEKPQLEARVYELGGVIQKLNGALGRCSENETQANDLSHHAKVLTDQYSVISTSICLVVEALGYVEQSVSDKDWDRCRFSALVSILDMLDSLETSGLLEQGTVKLLQGCRSSRDEVDKRMAADQDLFD